MKRSQKRKSKRRSSYVSGRITKNSPFHPSHHVDWNHRLARAWVDGARAYNIDCIRRDEQYKMISVP